MAYMDSIGEVAPSKAVRLGIAGSGYIAERFIKEAAYVAGVSVVAVYNPRYESAQTFAERWSIPSAFGQYDELICNVDAVYIASPCRFHEEQAAIALKGGVHVLCEKPMALHVNRLRSLYALAQEKGLTLMHAIKTAYYPGFIDFVAEGRSSIGEVVSVDATFTKLVKHGSWERSSDGYSGSMLVLGSYPLLVVAKLLGTEGATFRFDSVYRDGVDIFTRCTVSYSDGKSGCVRVGVGAKTEGDCSVTGTDGYLYVPAPWWQTRRWEKRFEDPRIREEHTASLVGFGLRYELEEFIRCIRSKERDTSLLEVDESIFITAAMESFRKGVGYDA